MVLGFGKQPGLLTTREIEDCLWAAIGDLQPDQEAWLITPYITIDKLSSLRRQITEACKRGATVNVVVRDEKDQVNPTLAGFKEALTHGLNLFSFHRLHAKVYWFQDNFSVITSANLVDASFEGSTEVGVIAEPGSLYESTREWIDDLIKPGLKEVSATRPVRKRKTGPSGQQCFVKKTESNGRCIRCGTTIPLNPERPYCLDHFRIWEQYRNPNFEEKFCHSCGKPGKASMAKPVCPDCYKRLMR